MKTYQYILLTSVLFVVLFYGENLGINFSILSLVYAILTYIKTQQKFKSKTFYLFFVTSVLSSLAFAWYGDLSSFFAIVSSLLLLSLYSRNKRLKPILLLPIMVVNGLTFICRFLNINAWLPKRNFKGLPQKILAIFFIPMFFVLVFFAIYSLGSKHFAGFFTNYELDFNFWEFICLSVLGFFIAFNYWNYAIEKIFYKTNHLLNNDFNRERVAVLSNISFLSPEMKRLSALVSFLVLNILLLFFIVTFNYEIFYENLKTPVQLSEETHDRVISVILSIVMVIVVVLFYFNGQLNFDEKAKHVKTLAKIWLVLNGILGVSTLIKNSDYVVNFGLTYKRLGVYAFLLLTLIGLVLTFYKIQKSKTNAFLFNSMLWWVYSLVLVCSFINWGNLATIHNLHYKKGDSYNFLRTLEFNDVILMKKFPNDYHPQYYYEESDSFLSKIGYYESLK